MKSLKPSMRENKRYLLVKGENLKTNIEKAVLEFAGTQGMSKACLSFIEAKKDWAIVSVNRDAVNLVRASLVVFPEKMEVARVSGTLKSLKALRSKENFDRKGVRKER